MLRLLEEAKCGGVFDGVSLRGVGVFDLWGKK